MKFRKDKPKTLVRRWAMGARRVFNQNVGDVTKEYYAELNGMGDWGRIGVALFRAQKRSVAAKRYRHRNHTRGAYDVKNWSLGEVCRLLQMQTEIAWVWKRDPNTRGYEWVLYVDLPTGQCSFHSPERLCSKDYEGQWNPARPSVDAIIDFCDLAESVWKYNLTQSAKDQPWGGTFEVRA